MRIKRWSATSRVSAALERGKQRHQLFARIENLTDELYSESSNATSFRPQPERDQRIGYRLRM